MKKLAVISLFLAMCLPAYANTSDLDGLFEAYAAVPGYKTVILGPKILQTMAKNGSEESDIIKNIEQIRVLSTLEPDDNLFLKAQSIAESEYEQVSINMEGDDYTGFYIKDSYDKKMSFLMIARREEQDIIMEISGYFSIKDISILSNIGSYK